MPLTDGPEPTSQFIEDWSTVPVYKQPKNIARNDELMALAHKKGDTPPQQAATVEAAPAGGAPPPVPEPPVGQPAAQPGAPAPAATPPQVTTTIPTETVVGAPTGPADSEPVQKRINRLYGQRRAAEEQNDGLKNEIEQLKQQLAQLNAPGSNPLAQHPQNPYTPQSAGYQQDPPGGDYISRAELQQTLSAMALNQSRLTALANAHSVSRIEAERQYPEVYNDPTLRHTADQIFASDPALQQDPNGPEKAALMSLGMHRTSGDVAGTVTPSPEARKQGMSGAPTDPTAPATAPAGEVNPVAMYQQALARANYTGSIDDMAIARMWQKRALGQS
jgi:hypothetical protein